jgi:hypothetical protein
VSKAQADLLAGRTYLIRKRATPTPNFGGQIMQTAIANLRELPTGHFRRADQARLAFALSELEDLKREYGFREES